MPCRAQKNTWQWAISTNTILVIHSIFDHHLIILKVKRRRLYWQFSSVETMKHLTIWENCKFFLLIYAIIYRYFGGWVAENIYYLGNSNVLWVRKGNHQIRIGGISGIYKDYHYNKGIVSLISIVNDKRIFREIATQWQSKEVSLSHERVRSL